MKQVQRICKVYGRELWRVMYKKETKPLGCEPQVRAAQSNRDDIATVMAIGNALGSIF